MQWQRLLSLRRLLLAPHLESAGIHNATLTIQIESIKDERLTLRVKDSAEGFLRAAATINIENVRNIKLPRTHQFANVPVGSEILFRVFEPAFLNPVDGSKFANFCFERGGPQQYSFALGVKACEFGSNILIGLVRVLKLGVQSLALLRDLLYLSTRLGVACHEFVRMFFRLTQCRSQFRQFTLFP